jgi:phosphatidylglycerol:prolipoprotein diacylglycerol transferase
MMSVAFSVSVIYFYKRALKLNLPAKVSTEISLVSMIGIFIGARIFHVIFEYPQYYIHSPLEIFKFWNGGFVFYGGLIGGLIAAYIYIKKLRQNFLNWLDCFAPVVPIGYMIGRVACIFAGCCYGKECDLPWAIRFPVGVEAPPHIPLHPTQIYSILAELLVLGILIFVEKKKTLKAGSLFFVWMFFHGIGRLIVEQYRGDFRGESYLGLSISSIISLALILGSGIWLARKNASSHS